jgi:hypothetical protein
MKKIFTNILLIFFSFSAGVVAIECGLRFFEKDNKWTITKQANILRNFNYDYEISGLYNSDFSKVNYSRNEFGLRDDCIDPSHIKILTVGGSTTDQRYVIFKKTFQGVLQIRLKNQLGNFGCVSNAGVDGHSTWGHVFSFKYWFPLIPNLSPDYVILYIGLNDTNITVTSAPNSGFDFNNSASFKGWFKSLRLAQNLRPIYDLITRKGDISNAPYNGHYPKKYASTDYMISELNPLTIQLTNKKVAIFEPRLKEIIKYIENMGAKPICVSQPHRLTMTVNGLKMGVINTINEEFSGLDIDFALKSLNNVMSSICAENYLNLYDADFQDKHFYDGIHTTEEGSIYIGNLLAEYFLERGLIFSSSRK